MARFSPVIYKNVAYLLRHKVSGLVMPLLSEEYGENSVRTGRSLVHVRGCYSPVKCHVNCYYLERYKNLWTSSQNRN